MNPEKMINSTGNFTSTNESFELFWTMNDLDIFLYSFNLLVGFPTHCYIIWLILTGSGSAAASEFFNLNLSVCEIGNCFDSLLFILLFSFRLPELSSVAWFFLAFPFSGRPQFQCLMCVERYLAVVHPVTFLKYKPLRYRLICCVLSWIVTLVGCFVSMFSLVLNYNNLYVWFYSVQFILFFHIQMFCLVAVLRALKQSGPGDRKKKEENKMKRRAFYLILITTLTMCGTYIPVTIAATTVILTKHFIKGYFSFSFVCFVFAGFVQPGLYLQRVRKLSCSWGSS